MKAICRISKTRVKAAFTRIYNLLLRNLRQSEGLHQNLYEELPGAYLSVGADGRINQANQYTVELLGYTRQELVGTPFLDLCVDTPSGKRKVEEVFRQFSTGQETRGEELEIHRADGSQAWVSLSVRPNREQNGQVVSSWAQIVDITDHRRTEEALQESERHYRMLVESSPYGIFSLDAGAHIIDCNEEACRLLDRSVEETQGQNFRELLAATMQDELLPWLTHAKQDGKVEGEFELVRRSGQTILVWAKAVALYDVRGDFTRAIVYVRDIAERKKLDQLKDEFIGLVSHELRSPLTVIMGAVTTALSEADHLSSEETRRLLQDAVSGTESLSHLLGNLLELSRAQANRLFLHVEPINIKNVVQSAIKKVRRQTRQHRFLVDIPAELPQVNADQSRLERVLYNLLENAVKYSPKGGDIRVSARPNGEGLVIAVADDGVGLSLADQDRIFGPFQRLEDSRFGEVGGVRLGLLVCRRLVEVDGGRIWVESQPGHGSTFYFTLPGSSR